MKTANTEDWFVLDHDTAMSVLKVTGKFVRRQATRNAIFGLGIMLGSYLYSYLNKKVVQNTTELQQLKLKVEELTEKD